MNRTESSCWRSGSIWDWNASGHSNSFLISFYFVFSIWFLLLKLTLVWIGVSVSIGCISTIKTLKFVMPNIEKNLICNYKTENI